MVDLCDQLWITDDIPTMKEHINCQTNQNKIYILDYVCKYDFHVLVLFDIPYDYFFKQLVQF